MKINRNPKTIVIEPDKQGDNSCWYDKEIITLRIASKELQCHKCSKLIIKGSKYIRDKFIFSGEFAEKQFKVNFICTDCWKGEYPPLIANNKENGDYQ